MRFLWKLFIYFMLAALVSATTKRADSGNQTATDTDTETEAEFRIQGGYRPKDLNKLTKYLVSIRLNQGGEIAKRGDGTMIDSGYSHLCGGTIVGNRAILTAAHCVVEIVRGGSLLAKASKFSVRVGSVHRLLHEYDANYAKLYNVSKIIKHRDYNPRMNRLTNDIALLILTEDIRFNERTQKADLPDSSPVFLEECTVVGWGNLFYGGPSPNAITYANLHVLGDEIGKNYFSFFSKGRMICASHQGQEEVLANRGDSGGPLFCNGKVAGVVSFGWIHSGLYHPSLYTNVYYYKDWIERNSSSLFEIGWYFKSFVIFIQIFLLLM